MTSAPGVRRVGGVVDEVDEHLAQALRVAVDARARDAGSHVSATPFSDSTGDRLRVAVSSSSPTSIGCGCELHRLREVEDLGDRAVEPGELLERDVEVLAIVVGQLRACGAGSGR